MPELYVVDPSTGRKIILFYHKDSFLSNFHYSPMTAGGLRVNWAESAYQYQKSIFFDDKVTDARILRASSPSEAKRLGRWDVRGFDPIKWDVVSASIMERVSE